MEFNLHFVRVFLVLVDDEQRPQPIRALHSISSDEDVTGIIPNIALSGIDFVRLVPRLKPLQVNKRPLVRAYSLVSANYD